MNAPNKESGNSDTCDFCCKSCTVKNGTKIPGAHILPRNERVDSRVDGDESVRAEKPQKKPYPKVTLREKVLLFLEQRSCQGTWNQKVQQIGVAVAEQESCQWKLCQSVVLRNTTVMFTGWRSHQGKRLQSRKRKRIEV